MTVDNNIIGNNITGYEWDLKRALDLTEAPQRRPYYRNLKAVLQRLKPPVSKPTATVTRKNSLQN